MTTAPSPLTSQGKITIIPVEICPDCNSHTGIGSRYESVCAKAPMIRSLHGVPQGYLFLYFFIWNTWMVEKTHTAVWDRPSLEGPLSWPVFDVNVECTAWGVHWSKPGLSVPFHPTKRLKSVWQTCLLEGLFGEFISLRLAICFCLLSVSHTCCCSFASVSLSICLVSSYFTVCEIKALVQLVPQMTQAMCKQVDSMLKLDLVTPVAFYLCKPKPTFDGFQTLSDAIHIY